MEPQLVREPLRRTPAGSQVATPAKGTLATAAPGASPALPGPRTPELRPGEAADRATRATRDRADGQFTLAPLAPMGDAAAALQAKCDAACACSPCADKAVAGLVQRKEAPGGARQAPAPTLRGGQPLPPPTRRELEPLFGADLGAVRVHPDHPAAEDLGARAFTVGTHVAFAPGAYQPESAEGRKLLAHELAHVVQQAGAAPVVQGKGAAGEAHEAEADRAADRAHRGEPVGRLTGAGPAIQRLSWRGALGKVTGAVKAVGGAIADVGEYAWDKLVDAFWAVVEGISTTAAKYLRDPGLLWDDIKGAVTNGAKKLVEGLFGPLSPLSAFSSLRTYFETLASQVPVIVEGLASFSFSGFLRALGGLARIAGAGMDAVIQPAEALFTTLDTAIGSVVRWLGKKVIDLLETVGGAIWTAAKAVVDAVLFIPRKIGAALVKVWNWVAGKVGLATGGDATGVWGWIKAKAQAVWDAAYDTVFGWVAAAVKLGKQVATSPFGGVLAGFRAMRRLAATVKKVGEALQSPNAVIAARKAVKAALDGAMAVISVVVDALGEAWAAVKAALAPIMAAASAFASAVATVLSWLGPKLGALGEGLVKVLKWVPEKIKAGFKAISSGGESTNPWIRGLSKFVAFLINLAINPLAIPMLIAGTIWKLLPASWKLAVMKWVVSLLLAILRATQLAALALMGPLAALAQQAVIGLLENVQQRLKGGTTAEENEVVKLSDRMAGIMQGTSFSFAMGLVAGLLEGIWDGLIGPFEMIGLLLQGVGKIAEFLGSAVKSSNSVLARMARAVAGAWSSVSGRIGGAIRGWLSESSGGSTAGKIVKLVASIGGAIANGAKQVGGAIANALFSFLSLEDFELGNKAGYVGGLVLFEVVLAVLTAGAATVLKGATTVVAKIIKVIVKIHEAFNAVMGRIMEMIPGVKRGIAALTKFVSESKAFRPIIEAVERMFREIEEAGVGALRRVAGNTTEQAVETGGRQVTKGAAEVAEHAPAPHLEAPPARVEPPPAAKPVAEAPGPVTHGPDGLPTRKLEPVEPPPAGKNVAAESGAVDNVALPQRAASDELAAIRRGDIPTTGAPPHRKAKIGEHTWEEGPGGRWCRHSSDPFCVLAPGGSGKTVAEVQAEEALLALQKRQKALKEVHRSSQEAAADFAAARRRFHEATTDADRALAKGDMQAAAERMKGIHDLEDLTKAVEIDAAALRERQRLSKELGDMYDALKEAERRLASAKGAKNWEHHRYGDTGVPPCFVAGTPVATEQGLRPIEALRVGDLVWAHDFESGVDVLRRVRAVHEGFATGTLSVSWAGQRIGGTPMHAFWDASQERWRALRTLRPGDTLRGRDGARVVVERVEDHGDQAVSVWNLEIEGCPTYFVGSLGVLVHNGEGSGFESLDRKKTLIYGIYDHSVSPPKLVYVGKSFQGEDPMKRFEQHVQSKPEWKKKGANLKPNILEGPGDWTPYETAVKEQHHIDKHGGTRTANPATPLENEVAAITEDKYKQFRDTPGQNPCR